MRRRSASPGVNNYGVHFRQEAQEIDDPTWDYLCSLIDDCHAILALPHSRSLNTISVQSSRLLGLEWLSYLPST